MVAEDNTSYSDSDSEDDFLLEGGARGKFYVAASGRLKATRVDQQEAGQGRHIQDAPLPRSTLHKFMADVFKDEFASNVTTAEVRVAMRKHSDAWGKLAKDLFQEGHLYRGWEGGPGQCKLSDPGTFRWDIKRSRLSDPRPRGEMSGYAKVKKLAVKGERLWQLLRKYCLNDPDKYDALRSCLGIDLVRALDENLFLQDVDENLFLDGDDDGGGGGGGGGGGDNAG